MIVPHGRPCHVSCPHKPLHLAFELRDCESAQLWLAYRRRPKVELAALELAVAAVPMELTGGVLDQQWRTVRPWICAAPPALYDVAMVCRMDGALILAAAADCMVVAESIAI